MMPSAEPLLDLRSFGLDLAGPDGTSVPILRDISFTVRAGERLGIVGESGSGKSLLALSIIGLVPASARLHGAMRLSGRDLVGETERERERLRGAEIAMVFQEPATALNPAMRVGDQIAEGVRLGGASRGEARRRALELLDQVRMPEASRRYSAYPHELSGGQRQRVGIAIALARDPALLIADEPTTALDVTVQAEVLDLLADLSRERGMALILVSHDLDVVRRTTERTLVLYAGTRVENGSTADVLARPAHPYTAALQAMRPRRTPDRRIPVLPGAMPPPSVAMPGCRFAPRCPLRVDACERGEPEWRALCDGRGARCIRPADVEAPR